MIKNIFNIAIIAIIFVLCSCDKNEILKESSIKINESDFFSVEYNYSDTIRLSANEQGYVDIVVASDKEDILKSFLNNYEYYLTTTERNQEVPDENHVNTNKVNFYPLESQNNFNEIPKISIDIIGVVGLNINNFDLKCRQKKLSATPSIQKISVNPTPWYYEYSSSVHNHYGKVKHTNFATNGTFIPTTLVRYGYKKCWLCEVISWEDGEWRQLESGYGYYYDINAFGYDGTHFKPGTNIYKLYTGVRSYSPDNFWVKFSDNQITYW